MKTLITITATTCLLLLASYAFAGENAKVSVENATNKVGNLTLVVSDYDNKQQVLKTKVGTGNTIGPFDKTTGWIKTHGWRKHDYTNPIGVYDPKGGYCGRIDGNEIAYESSPHTTHTITKCENGDLQYHN